MTRLIWLYATERKPVSYFLKKNKLLKFRHIFIVFLSLFTITVYLWLQSSHSPTEVGVGTIVVRTLKTSKSGSRKKKRKGQQFLNKHWNAKMCRLPTTLSALLFSSCWSANIKIGLFFSKGGRSVISSLVLSVFEFLTIKSDRILIGGLRRECWHAWNGTSCLRAV